MVNIQLFNAFHVHDFWGDFLIFGSIGVYFLVLFIENKSQIFPDLFGSFDHVMKYPLTYIALFFCAFTIYTMDNMIMSMKMYFRKKLKVKHMIQLEADKALFPALTRKETKRTGFAFAEDPGFNHNITSGREDSSPKKSTGSASPVKTGSNSPQKKTTL